MLRFFAVLGVFTCINFSSYAQALNTLSAKEKKEGWQLLFDGRDLTGWHRYNGKGVPSSWKIEQGALHLDVPAEATATPRDAGDLVTDKLISGDFAFKAEFRLEKYTNSGFFFFVQEAPRYAHIYDTGMEVQVGDDVLYGKTVPHPHQSGDLFSIADARVNETRPLGGWNQVLVTKQKNQLTVTINGMVVQQHDLSSADWKERMAKSKLKDAPLGKGTYAGRIGLQDWNTGVWFRNIKLRTF